MSLRNSKQKRCCVLDCPSNIVSKNCKYYKFPTDFDSCQKWKFALKLIGTISNEHQVCEAHFGDDDFVDANGKPRSKKQLKKDAHPTLNLPREHTYMKFGNPNRGRVTKAKATKKLTKGAPSTNSCTAPHASEQMSKAPLTPKLAMPPQYAYGPRTTATSNLWRVPDDVIAPDQERDPLALNSPIVDYINYKTDAPRVLNSTERVQVDSWVQPDSTQETASTTLTLTQMILNDAVKKVEIACKEIDDAVAENERFAAPSEPTEKITIHTQDSKVMELLLVKNNPKISSQVNDEFKTIDKVIDNCQALLYNKSLSVPNYPVHNKSTQTVNSGLEDENQRLKTEILSLRKRLDKMEKESLKNAKKVVMMCKHAEVSPFKKHGMSPSKKQEMSPFQKSFHSSNVSARCVEAFSMPKFISVTSLNKSADTEQSNAALGSMPSGSMNEMLVVDLTD